MSTSEKTQPHVLQLVTKGELASLPPQLFLLLSPVSAAVSVCILAVAVADT